MINKLIAYFYISTIFILKKIFRTEINSELFFNIYHKPYWSIFYTIVKDFKLQDLENYSFIRIDIEKELFEKYEIIPECFFDPFYFCDESKNKEYIFFEISYFDLKLKKYKSGDIFFVYKKKLENTWNYGGKIINSEIKISFPQIINFENNIYMIPETSCDNEVSLYKSTCENFPNTWKKDKILLRGKDFQDPVFFKKDDIYYLFVSTDQDKFLRIYFSEHLINNDFIEHPLSPVYKLDYTARAAGNFFEIENKLIRPSQYKFHGNQILFHEIKKLSKTEFEEVNVNELKKLKNNLYAENGVHHINVNRFNDGYLILLDGNFLKPHFYHNVKTNLYAKSNKSN